MFYDLIYTRCRHGVDILRSGQPVLSDGFKVYSCSSALYKNNLADLQFIMNSLQKKQSFSEPDFMDDAYLYAVPDTGLKILNVFHPVPYDLSVTGDFAKRPGMYLNHSVIGDFSKIYPYETFHNKSIWTAQEKNEAYYYEQEPSDIMPRNLNTEKDKYYNFLTIGSFIRNGRQEALKCAVAFLMEQGTVPAAKRKYLVIKETSSENIEMWIGAIELAFSPKIAANISFATRMDKYVTSNEYYVNDDGTFSQQQNSNAVNHARLRASIVGVVSKDKSNSVRVMEGSRFVVLDGEKKKALFDRDTEGVYFQLITSFDSFHERFSREFLQSFDVSEPSEDEKRFAESYYILCGKIDKMLPKYLTALQNILPFSFEKTHIIQEIYEKVNTCLNQFIQSSMEKSLVVLSWVGKAAKILGDCEASQRISQIISQNAENVFFKEYKNGSFLEFWENVKNGPFQLNVAELLNDWQKMEDYAEIIHHYEAADAVRFVEIYCSVHKRHIDVNDEDAKYIIAWCVFACIHQHGTGRDVRKILGILKDFLNENSIIFLIESVNMCEPESKSDILRIVINSIKEGDRSGKGDPENIITICEALSKCGQEKFSVEIMCQYIEDTKELMELEELVNKMVQVKCFSRESCKIFFERLDGRINFTDDDMDDLALLIQKNRPEDADCMKSAHLVAVALIRNADKESTFKEKMAQLVRQGIPCNPNQGYISHFVAAILNSRVSQENYNYLLEVLADADEQYRNAYFKKLVINAEKKDPEKWNMTVAFVEKNPSKMMDPLKSALLALGKKDRISLKKLITNRMTRRYYENMLERI